jgi:hypothetical protein
MTKEQARNELKRQIFNVLDDADWTEDGRFSETAAYEFQMEAQASILEAVDKYVSRTR